MIDQGERGQQRSLLAPLGHRLEQHPVDRVADHRDEHEDQWQGQERVDPEGREGDVAEVGTEDDELAVDQVDQAHDPEHEGQAEGAEGIQPAEQDAGGHRLQQGLGFRKSHRRPPGRRQPAGMGNRICPVARSFG